MITPIKFSRLPTVTAEKVNSLLHCLLGAVGVANSILSLLWFLFFD